MNGAMVRRRYCVCLTALVAVWASGVLRAADETFRKLSDGRPPQTLDELWANYDPQAEPLESETLKEWERDGVVCRVVRYRIGTFKEAPGATPASR
jgi:hypothetical protein